MIDYNTWQLLGIKIINLASVGDICGLAVPLILALASLGAACGEAPHFYVHGMLIQGRFGGIFTSISKPQGFYEGVNCMKGTSLIVELIL